MFTIPPYFLNFIEEPSDNGGGSSEPEFNLGVPDDYGQGNTEQEQQAETEVKDNPAWKEVYDLLPSEFHPLIQPKLKSWDDNFAKVQSQYAPYKPLIEKGVPYEAINTSMEFAQLLNANPRAVWEELGRRFNFGISEQGQQQVEEQEPDGDDPEKVFEPQDLTQNPQFAQLQQAYQQLEQRLQAEDQAKRQWQEEQQAIQEINSEWQAIESKVGQLPPQVKTEIIRRAVFIADQRGDGIPNLQEGYNDYARFVSQVRNTRANATAPDVMPGNGGLPKAKKNYGEMNEDEFVDTIAQMAKALAEGNQ